MIIVLIWSALVIAILAGVALAGRRTQGHYEMPAEPVTQAWGPLAHEGHCRCNGCR